jgi:hypothetical protein
MSKVDYLTEDTLLPVDQKFVCLSFLTDKDNKTPQSGTLSGIKIRGVFGTYEEACKHAKKVQDTDPYFNVFVGDMGRWLPFDPAPDSEVVKDSEYANEQLNQMMKAYLENQEKAKIYHEQRKTEMVRKNILDNLNTRHENLEDAKKKLNKAKSSEEKRNAEQTIQSIEEQIKAMEDKQKDLDVKLEDFRNQIKSMEPKEFTGPKLIDASSVEL